LQPATSKFINSYLHSMSATPTGT